jgi:threonine aldolase
MRYLSAQLLALLEDGLWLRHARTANELATQLAAGLGREGLALAQPVQANEVFAHFPAPLSASLRARGFEFYDWPAPPAASVPLVRLVTRYDQRPEQVEALLAAIRSA